MHGHIIRANSATLVLMILGGSIAIAEDGDWIIRGGGLYSFVSGDEAVLMQTLPPPFGQDVVTHSITDGPGLGIGVEYLWTERIGVEAAVLLTFHDSEGTISNDLGSFKATDTMDLSTFTLGANYHFPTDGRAEWSLGVYVPLMFSDDADLNFPALDRKETFRFDQDYGLGVKAGLDWSLSPESPWSLSIEARFMKLILESEEAGGDLDVDPAMLSAGFAYQF